MSQQVIDQLVREIYQPARPLLYTGRPDVAAILGDVGELQKDSGSYAIVLLGAVVPFRPLPSGHVQGRLEMTLEDAKDLAIALIAAVNSAENFDPAQPRR